jgi:undecaprenyl-diphosphatase
MQIIHAVILGIVEGISEFLPISSTGHLILTSKLLSLKETEFLKTFEISIQLGAILSVVVLYWRKLLVEHEVIKKVLFAFLPTAIIGLIFYKIIKTYLLGNSLVVVWALFLGGLFLIIFELIYKKKKNKTTIDKLEDISYKQSFLIGLSQSVAMIPGVSRSAATILGGLALGLSRTTIIEFSFLLAVPTMAAATGLDLLKTASSFSLNDVYLLTVGFVISFIVALFSIKFLLNFVKKYSFIGFGVYRIVIAIVFWLTLA